MSKNVTILLVEDEESIAYALKMNLEAEGYQVVHAPDAETAREALNENVFDILLLDVMLPVKSGFEVCKYFRERDKLTPVIFLSVLNDNDSKLKGLRAGADDFITKPFDLDELYLKIERLLFKANPRTKHHVFHFGNCWIDFTVMEAKGVKGKKLEMSKLEYDLAKLLIDNEGKPLKREYLYKKIWGYDERNQPNSRTLDNFIVFLRKYFEEDAAHPKHFLAVRGVGYKFQR